MHTYTWEDFSREHLEVLDPVDHETTAAHREAARAVMARALGRPTGTVGSSVSFSSGQLPTSAEIEKVRELSCGASDLVPCGAAYPCFFPWSWSRACGRGRNLTQLVPSVFFAQMLLFQSSAAPRVLWHEFPAPIYFDAFPVEKIGVGGVGGVGELVAG